MTKLTRLTRRSDVEESTAREASDVPASVVRRRWPNCLLQPAIQFTADQITPNLVDCALLRAFLGLDATESTENRLLTQFRPRNVREKRIINTGRIQLQPSSTITSLEFDIIWRHSYYYLQRLCRSAWVRFSSQSICLFVCLFVCLSVCLFVCLFDRGITQKHMIPKCSNLV